MRIEFAVKSLQSFIRDVRAEARAVSNGKEPRDLPQENTMRVYFRNQDEVDEAYASALRSIGDGNVSSHGDHATHVQYILASDDALRDCVLLIRDRTPLRRWPARLRLAMSLALRQSCDDTRRAPNRISACRANDLLRFLLRWKVVTQDEIESILSDTLLTTSDEGMVMAQYDMDRLLADLLSSVVKWR